MFARGSTKTALQQTPQLRSLGYVVIPTKPESGGKPLFLTCSLLRRPRNEQVRKRACPRSPFILISRLTLPDFCLQLCSRNYISQRQTLFSVQPLCSLCLCGEELVNHRDTENTEVAQRNLTGGAHAKNSSDFAGHLLFDRTRVCAVRATKSFTTGLAGG